MSAKKIDTGAMEALMKSRLQGSPGMHPAKAISGPRNANDHFRVPLGLIHEEGAYVREVDPEEEDFEGLVESIRLAGDVKQAISVRRVGPPTATRFVLVYGRRRLHAARKAGLAEVTVRDLGSISEADAYMEQIAENEARKNMRPMETAVAFFVSVSQYGNKQVEIATRTGKSPGYVSNMTKAGEALTSLSDEERQALTLHPRVGPALFRDLAPLSLEERVARLKRLAAGARPGSGKGEATPAPSRPSIRWTPSRDERQIRVKATLDRERLRTDADHREEVRLLAERIQALLTETAGS